jgi:chromosome segregation and condensation protein ScpB
LQFVPYELPEPFTSAELGKMIKLRNNESATVLNVLNDIEIVKRVGKKGNAYTYIVNT